MEPITAAIVAALASLSEDAVRDGYSALKSLLKRKFGEQSKIVTAAENLEKDPESEAWKAVLDEGAKTPEVAEDPEIGAAVTELQTTLQQVGANIQVTVTGQAKVQGVVGAQTVKVGEMNFGTDKSD